MNQTPEGCKNEASINKYQNSQADTNKELAMSHNSQNAGTSKEFSNVIQEEASTGTVLQHRSQGIEKCLVHDKHVEKTQEIRCRSSGLANVRITEATGDLTAQNVSESNVYALSGERRSPLSKSQFHESKAEERDVIAARTIFPEFFPRGPVHDTYDCLALQPTLEDIFSGRITSQEN